MRRPEGNRSIGYILDALAWNIEQADEHGELAIGAALAESFHKLRAVAIEYGFIESEGE